jgi:hypothetical protein
VNGSELEAYRSGGGCQAFVAPGETRVPISIRLS